MLAAQTVFEVDDGEASRICWRMIGGWSPRRSSPPACKASRPSAPGLRGRTISPWWR